MADYVKVDGVAAADIVKIDGVAIASVVNRNGATKPSTADYDWTESLWMDDNLTSDQGDWNDSVNTSVRELKNGSYARDYIPFIDDSSGTKYLKLLYVGEQHHTPDDFVQMGASGTRVQINGGTSPDMCAMTDTGVAFVDGELEDGEHCLQIDTKHDAKVDTYYKVTAVLKALDNNLACYYFWSTGSSSIAWKSCAACVANDTKAWEFDYDPTDNSWTFVSKSNVYWWAAYPGSQLDIVATSGVGNSGFEKHNTDWYVDGDTDEDRTWYVKSG